MNGRRVILPYDAAAERAVNEARPIRAQPLRRVVVHHRDDD